jgi:hypothetical protein
MATENPTPVPAPSAKPAGKPGLTRFLRRVRNTLIALALLVVGLGALYFFAAMRWSYSSGERAGYVQKFSKKGWVCKTWEGEIAMANLPGAMPELFAFTVRDDAVAAEVNRQLGARVVLSYEQHLGLPHCFGETQYWVNGVRRAEP